MHMKNIMITALTVLLSLSLARAQPLPAQDVKFKEFQQHGNLFDIRVVPAGKEVRLYLVGKEAASVKFEKLSIVGKIKAGKTEKLIEFHKGKDYFTTTDEVRGQTLHVKAKNEDSQNTEEFQIDLQKP